MAKKASDFRYNTGETKVPWAAVGENYNAEDLMKVVEFLMQGEGEEYEAALAAVREKVLALDKLSDRRKAVAGQQGRAGRGRLRRLSRNHRRHLHHQLHRRL